MAEGNVLTFSTIAGGGGCTPSQVWMGVPHRRSGEQDTPHQGLDGVPPPVQDWMGYLPPLWDWMEYPRLGQETDHHSEHLLHGRRYASCVHAGGLSCFLFLHPKVVGHPFEKPLPFTTRFISISIFFTGRLLYVAVSLDCHEDTAES